MKLLASVVAAASAGIFPTNKNYFLRFVKRFELIIYTVYNIPYKSIEMIAWILPNNNILKQRKRSVEIRKFYFISSYSFEILWIWKSSFDLP